MDPTLERFHPLVLHSILVAARRFEPDFYSHLCRVYHLDADRIMGLFTDVEESGPGQLAPIMRDLREHQSYHDIVYLAGRNSLHAYCEQQRVRLRMPGGDTARFTAMMKQVFPPFLGQAAYTVMSKGELQFVELRDSVFARGVISENPVCGFYSGFLAELGTNCIEGSALATEVRCVAHDPEASSCMFRVSL